jgi:fructose/tagatose bisphosphate aldolase
MVKAAEKKRSPLIIQMFPWAVTFSSGLLVYAAAQAAKAQRYEPSDCQGGRQRQ